MDRKKIDAQTIKEKIRRRSSRKTSAKLKHAGVMEAERHHLISDKAYFHAEQRGFTPGAELDDWLAAEDEIDKSLGKMVAGNSLETS